MPRSVTAILGELPHARLGYTYAWTGDRADSVALWDFERQYGCLPTGKEGQEDQLREIAEALRVELGVNEKVMPSVDDESIEYVHCIALHRVVILVTSHHSSGREMRPCILEADFQASGTPFDRIISPYPSHPRWSPRSRRPARYQRERSTDC